MTSYFKKLIIFGAVIISCGAGFFVKKNSDQKKEIELKNKKIAELKLDVESSMSKLIPFVIDRSNLQIKILSDSKFLSPELKKIITESKEIQFKEQSEFNLYEQKQNEIQNIITKKIVEGLKSKDKKTATYFQKNIKSLELLERDLNVARMNYSKKVYELSKLENKKAVTFLSDTALVEFERMKK